MTGSPEPTGFVQTGDVRIAYRRSGSGAPILLLNGTGESGATWAPLIERLTGFDFVATDARDTGHSTYARAPYTPLDLAADAIAVIEQLGIGPCHIAGYSLGGAVAQEVAIARPDLVRSLVLLSTWARSDRWFRAQMVNWQAARMAHWDDDDAFLRALGVFMFSPVTFDDLARLRAVTDLWDADVPAQRPEGWMRQTDADMAHDAASRLAQVRAPALVIVGEDDICTPPRYARALCDLLPDARLVTIPDAGHAALFEQTDAVAAAIAAFLQG